jgi:hypothetical protein
MKVSIDTRERIGALIGFFVECFKVFMACLLSVFVPQRCGNDMCSMSENFAELDPYNIITLVVNFMTLASFFSLYVVELNREYWLIKYLDIDRKKGEVDISTYTDYPKIVKGLQTQNLHYYKTCVVTVGLFILNIILSCILLFGMYYYDYRTITTLLSNCLLLVGKINTCYKISSRSYKEMLAISYYTVDNLSYNTIDEDYKIPSPTPTPPPTPSSNFEEVDHSEIYMSEDNKI